jgi:hypothetical protein
VIVPDGDEGPTGSRVLQVGIGKVALVDDAIAFDRQRVMEFAGVTAIGNAADFVDRAVVPRRPLWRSSAQGVSKHPRHSRPFAIVRSIAIESHRR